MTQMVEDYGELIESSGSGYLVSNLIDSRMTTISPLSIKLMH